MAQNTIAKGALISYVSIFLNIAISLVYTPWMIHKIGVSDYGLYGLVGSFLGYFMLDFGLAGTITRFVAKYRAEGNEQKVANMIGLTAKVYLVMDTIIFIVLFVLFFFLSDIFGGGLTPEEIDKLKVLYCISGAFSVLSFMFKPVSGAMMAYEFFVVNKSLDVLVRVGTVMFIVIMLLFGGNVYHVVFITGFVGFSVALLRYKVFIRKSGLKVNWRYFEKAELVSLFSFSVWVLIVQLSQMLRLNLIPTVLGIFNNTTEISVFTVGRNLEGMVYTISAALNGLFLPMVSRMVESRDRKGIMDLMIRVGRIQLYIIWFIFSGFCVFGESFIHLWVGETFHSSYFVFIFLVFVNVFSLTMQIGTDLVYAENKIKQSAIRILISSAIGLVLSCIVAPKYGALGCAGATGLALILTQILYIDFYQRKMGLNMGTFFKNCHLKILPLLVVYAVVGYCICHYLSFNNWFLFLAGIAVYTVGYFTIVWFLLSNSYEKAIVVGVFNKIR